MGDLSVCLSIFCLVQKIYLSFAGAKVTHHFVIFHQHHIIGTEGCTENDAGDSLKAVDPLLSLWSLPSHIKHPERKKHLFLNVYPTYDPHALGVYPREMAILGPVSSKVGGEGSSSSSDWALVKAKKHSCAPLWGIWHVLREQCTHLKFKSLTENLVSMMPVVLTLDRSTSCSLGR